MGPSWLLYSRFRSIVFVGTDALNAIRGSHVLKFFTNALEEPASDSCIADGISICGGNTRHQVRMLWGRGGRMQMPTFVDYLDVPVHEIIKSECWKPTKTQTTYRHCVDTAR